VRQLPQGILPPERLRAGIQRVGLPLEAAHSRTFLRREDLETVAGESLAGQQDHVAEKRAAEGRRAALEDRQPLEMAVLGWELERTTEAGVDQPVHL